MEPVKKSPWPEAEARRNRDMKDKSKVFSYEQCIDPGCRRWFPSERLMTDPVPEMCGQHDKLPIYQPISPFEKCPRFKSCSVNVCPLDPNASMCRHLAGEEKCTLSKAKRMVIAADFADVLPNRGLFFRELSAVKRWEALTPEQQTARKEAGRQRLAAYRALKLSVGQGNVK